LANVNLSRSTTGSNASFIETEPMEARTSPDDPGIRSAMDGAATGSVSGGAVSGPAESVFG
jgi:hypothetical protein